VVGASGEIEDSATDVAWVIQIHKLGSVLEKLLGRNKMSVSDPLSAILQAFVRAEPSFKEIDIDNFA